jgi:peptidoglycan/xylan/chitin deacetylase (PgdA/CDA1 family)
MKPKLSSIVILLFAIGMVLLVGVSRSNAGLPESVPDGTLRRLRVPIVMYHYISLPPAGADSVRLDLSVSPANFRQQMAWLKEKGFTTITPDDLYAALTRGKRLPAHPVLLTFDDGYRDAYTNAFPILKEFGFTGTFFVVSGFIDSGSSEYLTWEQVKTMAKAGMSIQNHSRTHKSMEGRDHDWLVDQIVAPGQRIEAMTGIRPRFFCYPSGYYDDNTIRELQEAGYVAAFTTSDGTFAYTDDMMRLRRVRMHGSTTLAQFAHLMTWVR